MQCERSGIYKPPKTRKKPNLEGIGSRKCNCPFRLKGFFDKDRNDWWIAMLCGMHNHDLDEKLSGHLIAGRLGAEEKKKVIDNPRSHFQRGKMHALALTPAHKLHRLLQNRFGISHTFHKFQIS